MQKQGILASLALLVLMGQSASVAVAAVEPHIVLYHSFDGLPAIAASQAGNQQSQVSPNGAWAIPQRSAGIDRW